MSLLLRFARNKNGTTYKDIFGRCALLSTNRVDLEAPGLFGLRKSIGLHPILAPALFTYGVPVLTSFLEA